MPTTRKRVARVRGSALPKRIKLLFQIGAGWHSFGDDEVERLWREHGRDYLATHSGKPPFALSILGEPEGLTD